MFCNMSYNGGHGRHVVCGEFTHGTARNYYQRSVISICTVTVHQRECQPRFYNNRLSSLAYMFYAIVSLARCYFFINVIKFALSVVM